MTVTVVGLTTGRASGIGHDVGVVVWEKVAYVEGPGGAFMLRAQPSGLPSRVATWSLLVVLGANIRQLLRRNQSWTMSVRRPEDDPWGPTVFVELFESKRDALDALDKVANVLRSRDVPALSRPAGS